jgi:alcohol oxidase
LRIVYTELILPQAETYEIGPNQPTHGSDGPLKVSFGKHELFEVSKQFLDVGPQTEKDRPLGYEGNDFTVNSLNTFCVCRPSHLVASLNSTLAPEHAEMDFQRWAPVRRSRTLNFESQSTVESDLTLFQHHYIYNKNLSNLSVMDGCLVNRVVIEYGLELLSSPF